MAGMALPQHFLKADKFTGVRGGVEFGFSSTTTERAQAEHYAQGRASTVFEMSMGMVDRGADVSWLSQYPHEREVLWPPLMGIECLGTRVDGSGLVVEARLSLNQMAQTLEVVAARRQCLVRDLCTQLKRELNVEVQKSDGWQTLLKVMGSAAEVAATLLGEWLDRIDSKPGSEYNHDDVRSRFEHPAMPLIRGPH